MTWNPFRARRDRAVRRIAAVFLERPHDHHFGFDIMQAARISSAMYPPLTRMCLDGWLSDGWEYPEGRRWYMLTDLGKLELGALLHEAGLWHYVDGELKPIEERTP